MSAAKSDSGFDVELPRSLKAERRGEIALLRLARPEKRNAIDDPTVLGIETFFASLPDGIKAVVLHGRRRALLLGARPRRAHRARRRRGHRAFAQLASRVRAHRVRQAPVVAVLHGAVVGGGLEIAAACHIRVAESSAYYALPEGSRGIFVGGGGSVRLPRLIGTSRMTDMMLTGRTYEAEEGQAIGLSHYLVAPGRRPRQGPRACRHASPATRR